MDWLVIAFKSVKLDMEWLLVFIVKVISSPLSFERVIGFVVELSNILA